MVKSKKDKDGFSAIFFHPGKQVQHSSPQNILPEWLSLSSMVLLVSTMNMCFIPAHGALKWNVLFVCMSTSKSLRMSFQESFFCNFSGSHITHHASWLKHQESGSCISQFCTGWQQFYSMECNYKEDSQSGYHNQPKVNNVYVLMSKWNLSWFLPKFILWTYNNLGVEHLTRLLMCVNIIQYFAYFKGKDPTFITDIQDITTALLKSCNTFKSTEV